MAFAQKLVLPRGKSVIYVLHERGSAAHSLCVVLGGGQKRLMLGSFLSSGPGSCIGSGSGSCTSYSHSLLMRMCMCSWSSDPAWETWLRIQVIPGCPPRVRPQMGIPGRGRITLSETERTDLMRDLAWRWRRGSGGINVG